MGELEEQGEEIHPDDQDELTLRMAYYEVCMPISVMLMILQELCERQPLLISNVCLRQNPNNVLEWQKRIALFKGNNEQVCKTQPIIFSNVYLDCSRIYSCASNC